MYPEEQITDSETKKKAMQKTILHYHPDKQDVEEHGRKWQVLCDEITKRLAIRYESCKTPRKKVDPDNVKEDLDVSHHSDDNGDHSDDDNSDKELNSSSEEDDESRDG